MDRPEFRDDRGYLDKWEVHRILHGKDLGPCALPATELLSGATFEQLLTEYRSVYIKPLHAWGGCDITKVVFRDHQLAWMCQGHGDWMHGVTVGDVYCELSNIYKDTQSVVQQAAPVVSFQDRPFDIRVHMQREWDGDWILAGMLARVGGPLSIVSNVAISGGSVYPVEEVLHAVFPTDHVKHKEINAALREVGYRVCGAMDQCHEFDELGLDLGMDSHGRLWLFEVNTNDAMGAPSLDLFSKLPDRKVYQEMIARLEARQRGTVNALLGQLFEMMESDGE